MSFAAQPVPSYGPPTRVRCRGCRKILGVAHHIDAGPVGGVMAEEGRGRPGGAGHRSRPEVDRRDARDARGQRTFQWHCRKCNRWCEPVAWEALDGRDRYL